MRMRKKKNLETRMERVKAVGIAEPRELKGKWRELSGGRELHIEIGCGKGRFAIETAKNNPDIFFVAIERDPNVIITAMEALAKSGCPPENLRFMNFDAAEIDGCFARGEVSRIYLNFSDPWPASKNKNKRLTAAPFLLSYARVLAAEGELIFKTDNLPLFEFSLEELETCGWKLGDITRNLHGEGVEGGVMTEYEERFVALGTKINRLTARSPEVSEEVPEFMRVESPEQLSALVRLADRIWREHYSPLIGRAQVDYMLDKFQSEAAVSEQLSEGYIYEMLTLSGAPCGYLAVKSEEKRLFLSKLYIEKSCRGRGFSHTMFSRIEELAAGLSAIYLTVNKGNDGSIAAYKKLGFEIIDSVVSDIGGGFVMDDYIMEKQNRGNLNAQS